MILSRFKVLADDRGAAIIELAIVAPVLAAAIIGIVDISNAYSKKLALEQAAQRAIEKIMNTTETSTVEATLANEAICQMNGQTSTTAADSNGVMQTTTTCNSGETAASDVTVTWRQDCISSGGGVTTQTTTDSATYDAYAACTGGATPARYVQVTVAGKYKPLFPLHFNGYVSSDDSYHISATAGTRTS